MRPIPESRCGMTAGRTGGIAPYATGVAGGRGVAVSLLCYGRARSGVRLFCL
jgi:hypothetical protein